MKIIVQGNETTTPVVSTEGVAPTRLSFDEQSGRQIYTIEEPNGRLDIVTEESDNGLVYSFVLNGQKQVQATFPDLVEFFRATKDAVTLGSVLSQYVS